VTRWQPSSIRQLPLYCNRRHGFRRGRDSNAVPSSDSIPASPCPPAFLPIGTRVLPCAAALDSRRLCDCDGWGELVLSVPSERTRSIVVTELIQLRPPTKHTDQLLLLPTIQPTCPDKTSFSGSQVQRYSLRLVFLPHIRFTAKSGAPVGSFCQSRLCSSARRIPQNRAVLASAPLGSAPLRRLTAPPCAPSLANYETNVFYWPAKAQFQPLEAHRKCPCTRQCH
jgi:hypothetical protein